MQCLNYHFDFINVYIQSDVAGSSWTYAITSEGPIYSLLDIIDDSNSFTKLNNVIIWIKENSLLTQTISIFNQLKHMTMTTIQIEKLQPTTPVNTNLKSLELHASII